MRVPLLMICLFYKGWVLLIYAQPLPQDDATLLLLHFENSLMGNDNEIPVSASGIGYGAGKHGSALLVTSETKLRYDTTANLFYGQGTIEFWINPTTPGAVVGMEVQKGLAIEIGNWSRMILNIGGSNGNPEVGVFPAYNAAWKPNQWSHIACTWQNGSIKFYFNGGLLATGFYNFSLTMPPSAVFNVGSLLGQFNQSQGLLDEFRISNRERSAQEIGEAYMMGLGIGSSPLYARTMGAIKLYETWNLYLFRSGFYKVPSLYKLTSGNDTINIPNSSVTWSLSDSTKAMLNSEGLKALKAGQVTLTAHLSGSSVSFSINIVAPVLPPNKEQNINSFLNTPAPCHLATIPVVIIAYLPTLDGINMDLIESEPMNIPAQTVANARPFVTTDAISTKFAIEEGSKYRGYTNTQAVPFIGFKIIDIHYVYEPVPRGFPVPWNKGVFFNDYNQILSRFNSKRYVDSLGVKEFWVYGYHKGDLEPPESNMSSPTTGDISNSSRFPDDMPVHSRTYIVYGHNLLVGPHGAGHIYGHQFEAMLDYVARRQDGNSNLFWQNFVGRNGNLPPIGRCGDTHHPPNTTIDYDYNNATLVESDIMDWKPSGGNKTFVNQNTWGGLYNQWPAQGITVDNHVKWYTMWMQSFPGNGNQIPHGSKYMTNWWRFLADWDSATTRVGLYQDLPEQNMNSCTTPVIAYSFTGNGKWSNIKNWQHGLRPPNPLPPGHKIIIDHQAGGECVLDVPFLMNAGINLEVKEGKRFLVQKFP